jgi:hypothetical protein
LHLPDTVVHSIGRLGAWFMTIGFRALVSIHIEILQLVTGTSMCETYDVLYNNILNKVSKKNFYVALILIIVIIFLLYKLCTNAGSV